MANDFKFGSKAITELYLGNKAVLQVYFGSKLIWEETPAQRTLVAGSQNVAIEYDMTNATQDLVLTSIEIFTDSSSSSSAKIKILHESGLFIAAIDGDTLGTQAEKYSLTGYSRSVDNLNITLYKGNKYYFVYQGSTNGDFYPAYFQNENGNYKVYANTTQASQITITNTSTFGTYAGKLNDVEDVFNLTENDFFTWSGDTSTIDNAIFVRSNKGNGTSYQGELGNSGSNIRAQDVTAFIYMSINDSFRLMSQNTGFSIGTFMYKSSATTTSTTDYGSKNTAAERMALLLMNIKNNTTTFVVSAPSGWEYGFNSTDFLGYAFSLSSGYSSQVSSLTPLDAEPSSPVSGGLYFIKGGVFSGYDNDLIWLYNGSWTPIYNYTDVNNYFSRTYITAYMTEIGTINDLQKQKISGDSSFINSTLNTDKKFYLKLNNSIEV